MTEFPIDYPAFYHLKWDSTNRDAIKQAYLHFLRKEKGAEQIEIFCCTDGYNPAIRYTSEAWEPTCLFDFLNACEEFRNNSSYTQSLTIFTESLRDFRTRYTMSARMLCFMDSSKETVNQAYERMKDILDFRNEIVQTRLKRATNESPYNQSRSYLAPMASNELREYPALYNAFYP